MIYVNFVSETCWQVIFEKGRICEVVNQASSESTANDLADSLKRIQQATERYNTCSIEESIVAWYRSLAYLVDVETDAWNNVTA